MSGRKSFLVLASVLAVPTAGALDGAGPRPDRQLYICMAAPPDEPVLEARRLVSSFFASIGVGVTWKAGQSGCPAGGVRAGFWLETPAALNPGALGRSFPQEGSRIDVFYDRVRAAVPSPFVPSVLAHVLMHELAHVVMGSNDHAPAGLMKARWEAAELQSMHRRPLAFDETDIPLIHRGLAERAARLGAQGPGATDAHKREHERRD